MQNFQKPAKPPIATKPKLTQKPNVIIFGRGENSHQPKNGKKNDSSCADNQPLLSAKNVKNITLPASPPNWDNNDDCCGILNHKHIEDCLQRLKKTTNETMLNGNALLENNDSCFQNENDKHNTAEKSLKISSHSCDSLSSSSGGFKDVEYVTKTRVAYDVYDKEEKYTVSENKLPIGSSKVQEMKSKLLAQQLQQQKYHPSSGLPVPICRQQILKSSKQLEKVLGLRAPQPQTYSKQEKMVKRLSKSFDDAQDTVASSASQDKDTVSKHLQQRITEEMKEMIKEKYLIEKIPIQLHYEEFMVMDLQTMLIIVSVKFCCFVSTTFCLSSSFAGLVHITILSLSLQNNRNQPAIGLKQTSKARVSNLKLVLNTFIKLQ